MSRRKEQNGLIKHKLIRPLSLVFLITLLAFAGLCVSGCAQRDFTAWFTDLFASGSGASSSVAAGELQVHFIDVGQGDAALIRTQTTTILIDGGPRAAGPVVSDYLRGLGISSLDLIISTHPHEDHIGGLIDVIRNFPIDEIIDPAVVHTTQTFEDYIDAIADKGIRFTEGQAGMSKNIPGGAVLDFLHPVSPSDSQLNDASIVTRLTFGDVSFLFTGDTEEQSENEMLGRNVNLKSSILKVGHHGSNSSTSEQFLSAVRPTVAVISCGIANEYGHPHQEVLDRLKKAGIEIYRTDLHGTIVFTTDGRACYVTTDR